jgi:putative aldouronate transport system permease protein
MRRTRGEQVFNVFNIFLLGLLGFTCLMPFVHIIAKSLSSEIFVLPKEVVFLPKGLRLTPTTSL